MSSCNSISSVQFPIASTSSSSRSWKSSPMFKYHPIKTPIKKSVPEIDDFAKRRKIKDDQLDRDLAEVSTQISTAVKTISSCKTDGYMSAIQEGLDYVAAKNKTQCLIEILQIIQKYEERL